VIVVSDASPLIGLACIGRLDLLKSLYAQVLVPPLVFQEVAGLAPDAPGAEEIRHAGWIQIRDVADHALAEALARDLDPGEAAAIALAVEAGADLLLMDERKGRQAATRHGCRVIGVLGILVEAKSAGLVPTLRPLLDDLANTVGFRIGSCLRARVLEVAGEA